MKMITNFQDEIIKSINLSKFDILNFVVTL